MNLMVEFVGPILGIFVLISLNSTLTKSSDFPLTKSSLLEFKVLIPWKCKIFTLIKERAWSFYETRTFPLGNPCIIASKIVHIPSIWSLFVPLV